MDKDLSFIEKFVGIYDYGEGYYGQYGAAPIENTYFDWRQLTWLFTTPILAYLAYKYFVKNKDKARTAVVVLSVVLLTLRLGDNFVSAYYGHKGFMWMFPYHLCSIMSVLLPIVVLFNIKSLKVSVYTLSIIGGIVTVLLGENFPNNFVTIYPLVSVIAHTLLIIIPIIEHASGQYRLDIRKSWLMFPIMLILMAWAKIGNSVIYRNRGFNFMYLEESGFPGGAGGQYYFVFYVIIFFAAYALFFVPPLIRKKHKAAIEKVSSETTETLDIT